MSKLKRVLITGAARGIGREMARSFARAGWQVVLTDVNERTLAEARDQLNYSGATAWGYRLDDGWPTRLRIDLTGSALVPLVARPGRVRLTTL